jgi:hypothetical protein
MSFAYLLHGEPLLTFNSLRSWNVYGLAFYKHSTHNGVERSKLFAVDSTACRVLKESPKRL